MKRSLLLLVYYVGTAQAQTNRDQVRYDYGMDQNGRIFGQDEWRRVTCRDIDTCSGYMDKFQNSVGWNIKDKGNQCKWCPEGGDKCGGWHRQSPIDLRRNFGDLSDERGVDCIDWHWMHYEDDTCNWNDMKDSFSIEKHALRISTPTRPNGDIDCQQGGKRTWPRIDYSKGFPNWWWLQYTQIKTPSEHLQHGRRYPAEVTMEHFYEIDFIREMGYVTVFLDDIYDDEPWPYLDKLICTWRAEEEKKRVACGRPPADPYGRCKLFRDQEPTAEWLAEAGIATSPAPTKSLTDSPTKRPSASPTDSPTKNPTMEPSAPPTGAPTNNPSASPSISPSETPTSAPSSSPSASPSSLSSNSPTDPIAEAEPAVPGDSTVSPAPTSSPSASPSTAPSGTPSDFPSDIPSDSPSDVPSVSPSASPSKSVSPSEAPSASPTNSSMPSETPSESPTTSSQPSEAPSASPTDSFMPSAAPSAGPTKSVSPSASPSTAPSAEQTTLEVASGQTAPSEEELATGDFQCGDYAVDYNRMCHSTDPCCESTRSDTNYCWNFYDNIFPGNSIYSACYHCCPREKKLVGPPNPPKEGLTQTVQCSADEINPQRWCKVSRYSCCNNPYGPGYCASVLNAVGIEKIRETCWYCCRNPIDVSTRRRGLRSNSTLYNDETFLSLQELVELKEYNAPALLDEPAADSDAARKLVVEEEIPEDAIVYEHVQGRYVMRKENFEKHEDEEAYFTRLHEEHRQRNLADVIHQEDYEDIDWFPYEWLIKVGTEYYWRYEGTQTIPPCREFVHWRVMKDPIRVAKRQMRELERLLAWRLNDSCEVETAGRLSPDGNFTNVARDVQYTDYHRKTFCECKDWPSKFEGDQRWCRRWWNDTDYDRFYTRPYNWCESGGCAF